jgi:hypothetical protein
MAQRVEQGITVRDGVLVGALRRSVNQAQQTASIHNDEIAQKLGFRGGTVAGSIHFELFPPVLLEAFGPQWFERGTLSINFRNATTDREAVRAHVRKPERSNDVQVDAWIEREDGMIVGEGSASAGDPSEKTALQQIDITRFEAKAPRILAGLAPGQKIEEADIEASAKAQDARLDVITEPLACYSDASQFGGLVASPTTLVHFLYTHPARHIGRNAGKAVGLFGAIEVRHVNGPFFLDRQYRIGGEILAVGESPKTEYVWFESYANTPDGERIAEMRMQLRWMKASSELYAEE